MLIVGLTKGVSKKPKIAVISTRYEENCEAIMNAYESNRDMNKSHKIGREWEIYLR